MTTKTKIEVKPGFTCNSNKGFSITFQNKWTISVQFGVGNYCENGYIGEYGGEKLKEKHFSSDCEIAIWDESGEWYNFGYDHVQGYCTPKEVAEWIDKVSKF